MSWPRMGTGQCEYERDRFHLYFQLAKSVQRTESSGGQRTRERAGVQKLMAPLLRRRKV